MTDVLFDICVTAMLAGIYRVLLPDGKNASQIKLLISCFFILSVIGAVRSGAGEMFPAELSAILDADISYNDYTVQVERLTAEQTADNLRRAVRELLSERGITPEKIYIDVNISGHGGISITEIKLVFSKTDHGLYAGDAVSAVQQSVGDKIKVSAEYASRYSDTARGNGGADNETGDRL